MKVLIITNQHIPSAISIPIQTALDSKGINDAQIKPICTIEELEAYDLGKECPEVIFILAELYWPGPQGDLSGYDIAEKILPDISEELAPNIQFVSASTREQLYKRKYDSVLSTYFIKSFQHHQLTDFRPNLEKFNRHKWAYLKKYAMTSSGLLDMFLHDLENLLRKSTQEQKNHFNGILERITELGELAGTELLRYCRESKEDDATYHSATDHLNQLHRMTIRRLTTLNYQRGYRESATKHKRRLLILEDDEATLSALNKLFEDYFEVIPMSDGEEALEELKVGGHAYDGLICDLQLLQKGKPFEQNVQGIEVFDYARTNRPHIAKKVITNLTRKGVRELLPDLSYEDILHKSLISNFGMEQLLPDFLFRLDRDIRKQSIFRKMPGPDTVIWSAAEAGGRLKLFYYEQAQQNPQEFKNMWDEIFATVRGCSNQILNKVVIGGFGKTENIKKQHNLPFLQRLLTNRLLMISRYPNHSTVIYRDDFHTDRSYLHQSFWSSKPAYNATAYCATLGFKANDIQPKKPTEANRTVTFNLQYNELFDMELEWLKSNPDLRVTHIEEFFDQHEQFCNLLQSIHIQISENKKKYGERFFKNKYPDIRENAFGMNEKFASQLLTLLATEPILRGHSDLRLDIYDHLFEFKLDDEDRKTPGFIALNANLKTNINSILDKFGT